MGEKTTSIKSSELRSVSLDLTKRRVQYQNTKKLTFLTFVCSVLGGLVGLFVGTLEGGDVGGLEGGLVGLIGPGGPTADGFKP